MEENQRKDPVTGEIFIPKRINQRFAKRQNQIRYNNLKAARKRRAKASIDKPLDKNRTILSRLLGDKKEIIKSRDYLLGCGYNFSYFTHSVRLKDTTNALAVCIYEFCLLTLDNNNYKIFKYE